MKNAADVSVLISCNVSGIARTLRMALRGMGVRRVFIATNAEQLEQGFAEVEPNVLIVYVDGDDATDAGLATLRHVRRSPDSVLPRIPAVAVSQRRDLPTINAVMNAGAHEYVLFPASGDVLLKRISAACQSTRPFIETADYVGPERKNVDVSKVAKAAVDG
jgi:DNA-binding NarL/FixJ family response regulator